MVGRHARWPMLLTTSPHIADPGRIATNGRHLFWTYTYVPSNSTADPTETVTGGVKQFTPSFRDIVVVAHTVYTALITDYVGDHIVTGDNSLRRAIANLHTEDQPLAHNDSQGVICVRLPPATTCTAWPVTKPHTPCYSENSGPPTCPRWHRDKARGHLLFRPPVTAPRWLSASPLRPNLRARKSNAPRSRDMRPGIVRTQPGQDG